ncbi:hypothetical protein TNCV_1834301 [Trichonephila clavipes]|nr:hypothetical protein TNCV_1834301 [Trichonephila clavipes]
MMKRNRNFTPYQIAANLATVTGMHVSARTISQRLNQVGLHEQKPVPCISLQPRHRRERCVGVRNMLVGIPKIGLVMFSDESRFNVTKYSDHQLLWR